MGVMGYLCRICTDLISPHQPGTRQDETPLFGVKKDRKILKYQKRKHNIYFGYRNLISSQQRLRTRQDSLPNKQESHHTPPPPPPPPSSSKYNPICLAPKEQETQIKTSNRTNTFGTNKLNSSLLIVWGAQIHKYTTSKGQIQIKKEQILFFFVDCLGSTTCGFCWPRPQHQIISNTIKSRKLFRWKYVKISPNQLKELSSLDLIDV